MICNSKLLAISLNLLASSVCGAHYKGQTFSNDVSQGPTGVAGGKRRANRAPPSPRKKRRRASAPPCTTEETTAINNIQNPLKQIIEKTPVLKCTLCKQGHKYNELLFNGDINLYCRQKDCIHHDIPVTWKNHGIRRVHLKSCFTELAIGFECPSPTCQYGRFNKIEPVPNCDCIIKGPFGDGNCDGYGCDIMRTRMINWHQFKKDMEPEVKRTNLRTIDAQNLKNMSLDDYCAHWQKYIFEPALRFRHGMKEKRQDSHFQLKAEAIEEAKLKAEQRLAESIQAQESTTTGESHPGYV